METQTESRLLFSSLGRKRDMLPEESRVVQNVAHRIYVNIRQQTKHLSTIITLPVIPLTPNYEAVQVTKSKFLNRRKTREFGDTTSWHKSKELNK